MPVKTPAEQFNRPLSFPGDLWDTRFGWYWYNEEEIFKYSQEDFDRKAETFHKSGINHVITFSSTHFRWSYRRDWDLITSTLAKVVRACHKMGIYVTEHHSCHLTHNPVTPGEEKALEPRLKFWPHYVEDSRADPVVIEGVRLSELRQIDGRTGSWARSNYHGWCMCFNNSHFRKAYLAYLETLYETGIDGIMTDDVHWYGHQSIIDKVKAMAHACACGQCQSLFLKKTGYEIPPPGYEWEKWHGDYGQASFRAWIEFRIQSIEGFHAAVKDHYQQLGLRLLRPNYTAGIFNNNASGYCLENLPHLDWVFQETLARDIIRYSWPAWVPDAYHRFSLARSRKIPPMVLFYPDSIEKMRFCWALALSWGVLYLGTPAPGAMIEGSKELQEFNKVMIQGEKQLREFELRHSRLLRNPRKLAAAGFYDSRRNCRLYKDSTTRSIPLLKAWMQACYMSNAGFDIIPAPELKRLGCYGAVVLSEIAILSDEELSAFQEYVFNGGILIWAGRTGSMTAGGVRREPSELASLWGAGKWNFGEEYAADEIITFGEGKLILTSARIEPGEFQRNHVITGSAEDPVPYSPPDKKSLKARGMKIRLLSELLPRGFGLKADNLPEGIIATSFLSNDGASLAIHLVNTRGLLVAPPGGMIRKSDPIAPVPPSGPGPVLLRVRDPSGANLYRAKNSLLHSLEPGVSKELEIFSENGEITVSLDPSMIGNYALVEVRLESGA